MPLKIVRNDITKMNTDAIVNTANEYPVVGEGCDSAVYEAAGREELLTYRREKIGTVPEGEVFLTPGFGMRAKYIIHAVSPLYIGGKTAEKRDASEESAAEEKLRGCYRKSLALAEGQKLTSIAFPLISTGSFGYPKEEGMRIAIDEINAFLLRYEMLVYLVVFDEKSNELGKKLYPELESYIDEKYVEGQEKKEYFAAFSEVTGNIRDYFSRRRPKREKINRFEDDRMRCAKAPKKQDKLLGGMTATNTETAKRDAVPKSFAATSASTSALETHADEACVKKNPLEPNLTVSAMPRPVFLEPKVVESNEAELNAVEADDFETDLLEADVIEPDAVEADDLEADALELDTVEADVFEADAIEKLEKKLAERMEHRADTFSQYLLYLIGLRKMENAEVYKRAIVDKKTFSKIKNNPEYHPQKITAMCLCIGARLSLDETRDLLARAGYALSPCDKTDIIFSYFIENGIYDMIELDIQLEEHGLPCLIS